MKRVYIALAVVFVALVGLVVWQVASVGREPVYKGRKLSEWLLRTRWMEDYNHGVRPYAYAPEAEEAIREIGTNGIPTLLRLLRINDSAVKTNMMSLLARQNLIKVRYKPPVVWNYLAADGFERLGTNAASAVPELIQIANKRISVTSQRAAIQSLGRIGPPAKPAFRFLLQLASATNTDAGVRQDAGGALPYIDPKAAAQAGFRNPLIAIPDEIADHNDPQQRAMIELLIQASAKAGITNSP